MIRIHLDKAAHYEKKGGSGSLHASHASSEGLPSLAHASVPLLVLTPPPGGTVSSSTCSLS